MQLYRWLDLSHICFSLVIEVSHFFVFLLSRIYAINRLKCCVHAVLIAGTISQCICFSLVIEIYVAMARTLKNNTVAPKDTLVNMSK